MKFNKSIIAGLALIAVGSTTAEPAAAVSEQPNPSTVINSLKNTAQATRSSTTYDITIHTADVNGAGTDGDVYVSVHGDEGWTPGWWYLDDRADNYERDRTDYFPRIGRNVGSIDCVAVKFHPLGGRHSDWLPDEITVNGVVFHNTDWFLKGNSYQYRTLCT